MQMIILEFKYVGPNMLNYPWCNINVFVYLISFQFKNLIYLFFLPNFYAKIK